MSVAPINADIRRRLPIFAEKRRLNIFDKVDDPQPITMFGGRKAGLKDKQDREESERSGAPTITTTAFCFPAPASIRAGNKTRPTFSARSTSSRRDAQQRGAMDAHHDHGYPGLSRVSLYYPER